MKKLLVAAAVCAACSAAMAQSSVTLFGVADVWLGSNEVKVGGTGPRQNVVDTSGINGSRWGLRGTEDLGGGLSAIFLLESGFDVSTGASAQGGLLFGRQAYVGLKGDFGTVQLGRQYSPYDEMFGQFRHNYGAFTFESDYGVASNGLPDYTVRFNNAVAYTTPVYNGFSAKILQSFGENKDLPVAGNASTDATVLYLRYQTGPIAAGYVYQKEKQATGVSRRYDLIGGAYDFGVVKLMGSYNTIKNNTTKDNEYQVGFILPFGTEYALSGGYTHSKSKVGAVENTGKGYSFIASYDISKRTRLYAAMVATKAHINNAVAETETTKYGLGIRHNF